MPVRNSAVVSPGENLGLTFDYTTTLGDDTITSVESFAAVARRGVEALVLTTPTVSADSKKVDLTIDVPDRTQGSVWVVTVVVNTLGNTRLSLGFEIISN